MNKSYSRDDLLTHITATELATRIKAATELLTFLVGRDVPYHGVYSSFHSSSWRWYVMEYSRYADLYSETVKALAQTDFNMFNPRAQIGTLKSSLIS